MAEEFDPFRDTHASTGEAVDDPFGDWPTRSLNDPIGELQGFQRLARALTNDRTTPAPGVSARATLSLGAAILIIVVIAQLLP